MRIRKIKGTAVLTGNVVDSLKENSTINAPSQRAVKEALLDVYSTEEKIIGTWVDGKPIYRAVFIGTTPSANNGVIIQIPDGYEVVNLYGFVNSWKTNRIPINSFSTTGDFVRVFSDTTAPIKILYNSVSAYFNIPFKIVVEYTKTTD